MKLTEIELNRMRIDQGFHFFTDKPEKCPYLCQCLYKYPCQHTNTYADRYLYLYLCQYTYPLNKLVEFTVESKDIVAIGTWNNIKSLVATKATLIEENRK